MSTSRWGSITAATPSELTRYEACARQPKKKCSITTDSIFYYPRQCMARAPAVQVPYSPTGYARRSSAPKLRCHSDRSRSARDGEVEEPAFNVLTGHTGFPLPPGRNYNPYAMLPKAGYSTPMLHVADVARSIRFY